MAGKNKKKYFEPQSCALVLVETYYFTLFGQLFKGNHMENFELESNMMTSVTKDPICICLFLRGHKPKWLKAADLTFKNKINLEYFMYYVYFM